MGLQLEYIEFINKTIRSAGFQQPKGLRMCELGNQHIRKSAQKLTKAKTGKDYFSGLGYEHISIDWNGQDGALAIDLRKPIEDPALIGRFDVLTNSGTTEHVEDQYECFKNLHRLVKQNGLLIHLNPMTGSWPGHGLFYYTFDFHRRIARLCGYKIVSEADIALKGHDSHLVCVGLRKSENNAFTTRPEFDGIAQETVFSS